MGKRCSFVLCPLTSCLVDTPPFQRSFERDRHSLEGRGYRADCCPLQSNPADKALLKGCYWHRYDPEDTPHRLLHHPMHTIPPDRLWDYHTPVDRKNLVHSDSGQSPLGDNIDRPHRQWAKKLW
mgnify:CR=1 FL=1